MVHFQNAQSLQLATARLTAVKGEAGTGKSVVLAHVAAELAHGVGHLAPVRMMV